MKQNPPWFLIASIIAAGGLTALTQAFSAALPKYAGIISAVAAIVVAGAGVIVTYYQAINAPAVAVLKDAPVVNSAGEETGATNLSSSSQLFQKAN
jgi:hypothetical protein